MSRQISFQNQRSDATGPEAPGAGLILYSDRRRWTPRRWVFMILGLVLAQAALIWILAIQPAPDAGHSKEAPLVLRLQAPALDAEGTAPLASAVSDAALLPMPSRQGFSGGGWLEDHELEQPVMEWTNAFRGLALDERLLETELQLFEQARGFAPVQIADKAPPPLTGENLSAPNVEAPRASRLLVEGVGGRRLLNPPELPTWTHTELVTNTVIQVLVDEEGWVFSRSPLAASGFPMADQWALAQSRNLRFEPASPNRAGTVLMPPDGAPRVGNLALGRLIFQWRTL